MGNTRTCIECKKEKGRSDFHKKQWKLQDEGTCIDCRNGKLTTNAPARLCSGCNQEKSKDDFHKRQWSLKDKGECICCIESRKKKEQEAVDSGEMHSCSSCNKSKVRADFYRKQWVLENGGECKPCFDSNQKRKQEEEAIQRERARESKKRRKLEIKRREREANKELRQPYYLTYGVGYRLGGTSELRFKTDPLVNESLVGNYNLVFYYSANPDGDEEDAQDISRTARGSMELSLKEFNDKPALFGTYQIDTRVSNGTPGPVDNCGNSASPWGGCTSPSFIEFDPEILVTNGPLDVFETDDQDLQDFSSSKGRKDFIVNREEYQNDDWLKRVDPNGDHFYNWYCGAAMKIVAERRALALDPTDKLCQNWYGQYTTWSGEGYEYEQDNTEWAKKAMETYRDGSNSWMRQHLNVPAEVAFKIREFVAPPPVFHVEEGDLVLVVQETLQCEWTKILIFRKAE